MIKKTTNVNINDIVDTEGSEEIGPYETHMDYGIDGLRWPNPPKGPPKMMPNTTTTSKNKEQELLMRANGYLKYQQSIAPKATPKGTLVPQSVTDRPAHFNLLKAALPKVTEGLRANLKATLDAKGRTPMWLGPLSSVDPSTLAYIGLLCAFNGVLKGHSFSNLLQSCGQMIEQELLLIDLMASDDKKTNKRLIKQVTKAHSSRDVRLKALRNITVKNGFRSLHFGIYNDNKERSNGKLVRSKYATPVISAILEHCDVFDYGTEYEGFNSRVGRLVFTPEASDHLEQSDENLSWMRPMFAPMLTEPKPWTAFDTGCYENAFLSSRVSLVRQASLEQKRIIERQFTKVIPTYARAASALQSTPLAINTQMLEAVSWAWSSKKSLKKFPKQELPERPRLPEDHLTMEPKAKAAIKSDIRKHFALERQVKGAAAVMRQDLETAHDMAQHEQFYLPVNLDFRGRMYFVPTFNYHRDDHIRCLFDFARGYKIEGNNAYWLKVHLANCGDFGKISKQPLDARAIWTNEHHDEILSIAADFRSTFDLWSTADKPFSYLSACFEYARFIDEGDDFVGYVPISLDGTNSGVQHYAGLGLYELEGSLVNLVPYAVMSDIYKLNAGRCEDALRGMVGDSTPYSPKSEDGHTVGHLARLWLNYGVTRTVLKRAVMTFGYSSKAPGMSGQYLEDIMKPAQRKVAYGELSRHPFGSSDREQSEAARFMGGVSYAAIRETLPNVTASMDYLQGVARAVSSENKSTSWTTPSGFPIVQCYRKKRSKQIKVFLFDRALGETKRTNFSLSQDEAKVDAQKSMNAIAPNYVHGLDAAHMHLTICNMLDRGAAKDFVMIHDSFATSGDTWDLFHSVRDTFVNMYAGDCHLERFESEIRQTLDSPDALLPTIPAKGALDIRGIKNSEFCFS